MSVADYTRSGDVGAITIEKPPLNLFDRSLVEGLEKAVVAAADDRPRALIVRAEGKVFTGGVDVKEFDDLGGPAAREFASQLLALTHSIEDLPFPTLAAVHNLCLTAGLELALACDLLIAGSTATLSDTHGKWGLAPIWGMSVRLTERVGPSRAKEMMFTAHRVDATAALAIGLVDRAVDDADLDATVDALAAEIAANSAGTNRIVKRLVHDRLTSTHDEALLHERTSPYGLPDDMAERMARPRK